MARLVPVADEQTEVAGGRGVGDRDARPLMDVQGAEAAGGPVHCGRGEVGEGADLILGLKLVGVVSLGRNRAVGPQNSILP